MEIGNKNDSPLLNWCGENFDMNLENILLISCHHILESNLVLLKNLFKKNLKPKNVWCLGKCYSTNKDIFHLYKEYGIQISDQSKVFDPNISFQSQYSQNIKDFLKSIIEKTDFKNFDKVIVWDDGGELLYQINNLPQKYNNLFGIEHTSNGFHKLKSNDLGFPVINVARSKAKLVNESPFIAELAIKNLHKITKTLKLERKQKILIIGGGAIGSACKKNLEGNYSVDVYDIDKEKSTVYGNLGEIINHYDVIIGATGNNVLSYEDFKKLKKGIVLMSVSSGDYEFCSLDIRTRTNNLGIWEHLELDGKYLLNGGFPITFTGEKQAVPLKKIQLTRGLIYGAIYQIVNGDLRNNGFIDFDKVTQEKIVNNFKTYSIF